jgi:hypothetical protein
MTLYLEFLSRMIKEIIMPTVPPAKKISSIKI